MFLEGENYIEKNVTSFVNLNNIVRIDMECKHEDGTAFNKLVKMESQVKECDIVNVSLYACDTLDIRTKIYSHTGEYKNGVERAKRWLRDKGLLA